MNFPEAKDFFQGKKPIPSFGGPPSSAGPLYVIGTFVGVVHAEGKRGAGGDFKWRERIFHGALQFLGGPMSDFIVIGWGKIRCTRGRGKGGARSPRAGQVLIGFMGNKLLAVEK